MRGLSLATSWILGGLFMLSGGLKSIDGEGPIMATGGYDILPAWQVLLVGAVLPALEVVIGAALVVGWCRRGAAAWAVSLGVVFGIANGIAWLRGLIIDCQCFGGLGGSTPTSALGLDGLVIVLGVVVLIAERRRR